MTDEAHNRKFNTYGKYLAFDCDDPPDIQAIDNASALEMQYAAEGKNIFTSIKDMNPFTSVYKLIEQFMIEIS